MRVKGAPCRVSLTSLPLSQACLFLAALLPAAVHPLMFQPLDCADIYNDGSTASGVYRIYPAGSTSPVYVYCDMDTEGGKWTVFQRRTDGTLNFYRGWEQYRRGFGHAAGEYWLGLETIHLLTLRKKYELRVDLQDFEGGRAHASYSSFSLSPLAVNAEVDGYTLHISGFQDGGAGDSLTAINNGQKFSTFDRDQDPENLNCAEVYYGAFWYGPGCHVANPNGLYLWGSYPRGWVGVVWHTWKGSSYSLKHIEMKMRPVSLALSETVTGSQQSLLSLSDHEMLNQDTEPL
ncbi:microfibril-associated glycoprotein 4-like isoform X2 [Lepisosteus oculatus]|uniref:microfibril-associated glycoprotein 4-like isoform X2 n=1 Tax=Lepisosteus oculatus TaxID=7918 RepID=UPI0035F519D4